MAAETARNILLAIGVTVVIEFADVTFGGSTLTRLSLVGGGQLNTVDLVTPRSTRYAKAVLSRALTGSLRGQSLRVVSAEDFVILKVLSTRARDLEDAASVLEKQRERVDVQLMNDEIAVLATELPDHDVRGRFASLSIRT